MLLKNNDHDLMKQTEFGSPKKVALSPPGTPQTPGNRRSDDLCWTRELYNQRLVSWWVFHQQIGNMMCGTLRCLEVRRFGTSLARMTSRLLNEVQNIFRPDHWEVYRNKAENSADAKNKMKPTNPNADTYVEKQRCHTYLSQISGNPLVEHPDLTHRGDTLVGHPCLTLLRHALVRHSCLTLWFDTLAGHSYLTLLWDMTFLLDWHSSPTLLLDTLVRHSYLTLL